MTTYKKRVLQSHSKIPPPQPKGVKVERKLVEYELFIQFLALPSVDRPDFFNGCSTQAEFAAHYKVNEATLSIWKRDKGFFDRVDEERQRYFRERMGNVWRAVERRAIKEGTAPEAKLLAEYAGSMKKDTGDVPQVTKELAEALNKVAKLLP